MDVELQKLKRIYASTSDKTILEKIQRMESRQMNGPFDHLINEWVLFVDDYSHYRGLVHSHHIVGDDVVFSADPVYQCSKFWDQDNNPSPPQNDHKVSNGKMILRSSRFKLIGKQPDDWPK